MHRSRTHSKNGNTRKTKRVGSSTHSITCTKPARHLSVKPSKRPASKQKASKHYNVFHILPEKNASLSFNARTRLEQSLFELHELEHRLYELEVRLDKLNDKHSSAKIDAWLYTQPPKSARLTITQVRPLAAHRHALFQPHHKKTVPCIYVVEPQHYDTITLLTPSSYMFEEDQDVYTKDSQEVGYFHSDKSGLALSGGGSDIWWLANPALVRWVDSKLRTGRRLLDSYTV